MKGSRVEVNGIVETAAPDKPPAFPHLPEEWKGGGWLYVNIEGKATLVHAVPWGGSGKMRDAPPPRIYEFSVECRLLFRITERGGDSHLEPGVPGDL